MFSCCHAHVLSACRAGIDFVAVDDVSTIGQGDDGQTFLSQASSLLCAPELLTRRGAPAAIPSSDDESRANA
jgi:hypothetical protein